MISLDTRMRDYEKASKLYLTKRMPVVIRIDGRSFSKFTKNFEKPFDRLLSKAMQFTMKYLCENVQGCKFGYAQSDEISLILVDYDDIKKSAWYNYNVQKLCSVVSSMATMYFNKIYRELTNTIYNNSVNKNSDQNYYELYSTKFDEATFDTRCFNVPENDICNYIIWRQRDAARNSVSSLGQKYFAQNYLNGKHSFDIINMLIDRYNVHWESFPNTYKYGSACFITNEGWVIDCNIPRITEDRQYVESRVIFNN